MKKALVPFLAMSAAVAMGETTLTTVATMDSLIANADTITAKHNTSYTNDTVYSFSSDKLITGISSETLNNTFSTGTSSLRSRRG